MLCDAAHTAPLQRCPRTDLFYNGAIMRPPADPTHLSRCAAELDVLLGALSDLYFRCDAEDRLIDYRARAPHELYVPPDSFLGKTFSDVIAPEAAARRVQAYLQQSASYCVAQPR